MGIGDILGAAARYVLPIGTPVTKDRSRQLMGWEAWADTPEVQFAATWTGNTMGRATLFAGKFDAEGKVVRAPDDHPATRVVKQIAGGQTGQSQLLTEYGTQLTVAAEGWTIVQPRGDTGFKWDTLSVLEVKERGKDLECEIDGQKLIVPAFDSEQPSDPNAKDPIAIRIWTPDPRRHINAAAPIFSSFGLLEELRLLNAAVAAIAKSRLTGRGIVFFPKGTSFPTSASNPDGEDDLLSELLRISEIAYTQPNSAAAAVPIFLEVPAEFIGQAQHMTFESSFDDLAIKLREECIRRFASALDMPAEILLGQGDMNHWGVWASNQTAVTLACEPKLKNVCDGFTTQWMTPILEAEGLPDATDWMVWFDPAGMRSRTNQAETALELRKLDAIGNEALRRETNFSDDDAPTPQEILESKILNVIGRVPEYVPQLLELIGIHVVPVATSRIPEPVPVGEVTPPTPADELPVSGPPSNVAPPPAEIGASADVIDLVPPSRGELVAAADGLVHRALERAGQRLKSKGSRAIRPELDDLEASLIHLKVSVTEDQLDDLLHEAWDRAPEIAERYGVDAECLTASLDGYCRELLVAGVPHHWTQMPAVMNSPCFAEAV